ncbi:MAG: Holliday junction branch migration protein RuvA [Erysipelotrichaceae bacterium]|nr:Holliday junction branch migration protein RuvA [Erysipelotrichaceae bacterium]MDY5252324.1 Holliday junction branch migration protein RuvA [Erysipelotrichaceae bacterium]
MIAFIKGIVVAKNLDHIIVENNGVGYRIFFVQFDKVVVNQEACIYTYQHVREDEISLYGFSSQQDHDLFIKLISVKGLGPKTALNAFKISNAANIIKAIENNDLAYIKKLPGVGAKTASQIILDLKGKLVQDNQQANDEVSAAIQDAIDGLKALGYKPAEIQPVIKQLKASPGLSSDEYLKMGLQLMLKRKIGG